MRVAVSKGDESRDRSESAQRCGDLSRRESQEHGASLCRTVRSYHCFRTLGERLTFLRHFLELINSDSFKELGLRIPSLMAEIQESFAVHSGVRKRVVAISRPDDEPKKKQQYRAPR